MSKYIKVRVVEISTEYLEVPDDFEATRETVRNYRNDEYCLCSEIEEAYVGDFEYSALPDFYLNLREREDA